MTFVRLRTRDGDTHIGHLDWWRNGQASIAGHLIDGVVFIDAAHLRSGGRVTDDTPGSATGSRDAHAHGVVAPAAASTASPTADRPITTNARATGEQSSSSGSSFSRSSAVQGTDRERRSGRWTCLCGHSKTAHHGWRFCAECPTCDRFRPRSATKDAAAVRSSDGA